MSLAEDTLTMMESPGSWGHNNVLPMKRRSDAGLAAEPGTLRYIEAGDQFGWYPGVMFFEHDKLLETPAQVVDREAMRKLVEQGWVVDL